MVATMLVQNNNKNPSSQSMDQSFFFYLILNLLTSWQKKKEKKKRAVKQMTQGALLFSNQIARSQRAVENREKWRTLVVKSSVVPQHPLWLRDR